MRHFWKRTASLLLVFLIVPAISLSFGRSAPAGIACALNLFFLISLFVVLGSATSTPGYSWIEYGGTPYLYALLCIPLVTTVLAIILPVAGALTWRSARWPRLSTLHFALVALALVAFIPFLVSWNLLGFNL